MMNCFLWYMVDQPKAFSFIFSWDHCQRSSSSRISDTFSPLCLNFMVSEWGHNCPTFLSLFGSWQIYIIHKCNISALYNLIFKISLFAHPCKILSCFSNQLWYLDIDFSGFLIKYPILKVYVSVHLYFSISNKSSTTFISMVMFYNDKISTKLK